MTEESVKPIRGSVSISVTTSTENLIAGKPFSIFVKIHNPFETAISIQSVSTYIPTEFIDIDFQTRQQQIETLQGHIHDLQQAAELAGLERELETQIEHPIAPLQKPNAWHKLRRSTLGLTQAQTHQSVAVARQLGQETQESLLTPSPLINDAAQVSKTVKQDIQQEEQVQVQQKWRKPLEKSLQQANESLSVLTQPKVQEGTVLQPGNSTTHVFTLKSRNTIWFRPSIYTFNLEVKYTLDGSQNVDTVSHTLKVRSALTSIILGSVIGGSCGWLLKNSSVLGTSTQGSFIDPATWPALLVSLVISMLTVVILARKKGSQPVVSIEDFWGGIAIGFMASYAGPAVLEQLGNTTDQTLEATVE